jgi:hypothetical protein
MVVTSLGGHKQADSSKAAGMVEPAAQMMGFQWGILRTLKIRRRAALRQASER